MAQDEDKDRFDIRMSPSTAKRFAELRDSIREIGHSRPTPKTLISALIDAESRRGVKLENELLVPFRKANPDAE